MSDIQRHFEDLRHRNNHNFTRETLCYIAEMEEIHCQAFHAHTDWKSLFEERSAKIDLLLYEAERDITIAILLKIKEQV